MNKLVPAILLILLSISTKAQTFTCPLMGWTATAPTGWLLNEREHMHSPLQNVQYFKTEGLSMNSDRNAPPTSTPPPPTIEPDNPKEYQGVTIAKTDYNYITIETHRIPRKHTKDIEAYRTMREKEMTNTAQNFSRFGNLHLSVEQLSDTERIADKKFFILQQIIQQHQQPKLRIYNYNWYSDKQELHATIVVENNLRYLQDLRNILTETTKSLNK